MASNFILNNNSCNNNYEKKDYSNYDILIYKNNECSNTPKEVPSIDFGKCYEKIKKENYIDENEELIVTKVDIKNGPSSYAFYHPYTLEQLDSSSCENQTIIVKQDISGKLEKIEDTKEEFILNLIEQGINVFNVSDAFYTDICSHYKSPNGKDVPLKARLTAFFPNITLCENGCENVGVDLHQMRAKCECKFINLVNVNIMGDNLYSRAISEILDVISELNIAVVKCFKDIFNKEKFIKCTGGFIILTLFAGQIACLIKYAIDGLYRIRKYFFTLSKSYLDYVGIRKNNQNYTNLIKNPPIRNNKKLNSRKNLAEKNISTSNLNKNFHCSNGSASKNSLVGSFGKKALNLNKSSKNTRQSLYMKKTHNDIMKSSKIYGNKRNTVKVVNRKRFTQIVHQDNKEKINMKEYLSLSFNEDDFDDIVDKEKRPFCKYFSIKFKENQIFINTFFIKEPLRPRALKCLVLIITIELYFVISALFYNEDYLTDLFYSTEEEKFYSFIPRRFNDFIYTSTVSGIISYLIDFFFIDEIKFKKILIRNKKCELKMKYEISIIVTEIEKRFLFLIYFSIFLTIICYIYISCFNNVYPYIRKEWINSSLFILAFMQFINLAFTFIQCSLRYLSIKFKSEKIFKLSQIFAM